ncbi:MAG: hypothetical protein HC794_10430 [Nitrospiraceae bacterium]|nr:hypothetical protein [Nitrospiraceae bacterium]
MAMVNSRMPCCVVQPYTETVLLRGCLDYPLRLQTTRCYGLCYSQDRLIYDWKSEPPYQHQHRAQCCSPNVTQIREIAVVCKDDRSKIYPYSVAQQCECRSCSDPCHS